MNLTELLGELRCTKVRLADFDADYLNDLFISLPGVLSEFHLGGSVAVEGEGNDFDIICLVENAADLYEDTRALFATGKQYDGDSFCTYRDITGRYNLIVTWCPEKYQQWRTALRVCQALHSLGYSSRGIRVAVHSAVLDE